MTHIGIIGAGVAGLHLGLFLQQRGVEATIYTEKTPGEQFASRLPALVGRSGHTRERERLLGVNHWDAGSNEFGTMNIVLAGEQPLGFAGNLERRFIAVDMRIYFARLLEDFVARGGNVVFRDVHAADIDAISEQHDLLVVATGRGGLNALFPRLAEHSPFDAPQRYLCTGLYRGIAPNPDNASAIFVPEQGEVFEFPIYTFEPGITGLGLEAVPGSALEPIARMNYDADPAAFNAAMIELLRVHAPAVHARVDPATFGLTRSLDLLQGGVTPSVRSGHIRLANGKYALALGDVRAINDPITGQGANSASATAWMLGAAICASERFDEAFCTGIEQIIWDYIGPIAQWSNAMLQPPAPHVVEFMVAAAQFPPVAETFVRMFEQPVRAWEMLSCPNTTGAFLKGHGWKGMPVAA
ncbi:MAG TPA: styrene monooxygenase/indole monooxygenase family protein [Herpetosiphonaceae bacterium]|nr:styrene monooxygenase/indole monooxygenase family protein [Herpetosiphonaceae bacterium]